MAGKIKDNEIVTTAHDTVYENNLRYAVSVLKQENMIGLVEPINKYSIPQYYMNSYEKGL